MNPIPMLDNFHSVGGKVFLGANVTRSCIGRDDRPGGITDQMTWGQICFSGSEPHLLSVLTTTYGMTFSDWKGFVKKQIAHSYETDVLGFETLYGERGDAGRATDFDGLCVDPKRRKHGGDCP